MDLNNQLSHRRPEPECGVLYIVGTPIGNLSDISKRALNILEKVFLVACEDTRQTRKIMNKFGINNNLVSFNMHNAHDKKSRIITYLKENKSIALVSDAGMPTICDPGEELIKESKLNGIDTICIPGPCAALTALVSSGFTSSKFTFEGFLPKKKIEREKILLNLSKNEKTTILYESPHRILKTLKQLKDYCGGKRAILVARELTKKYEEHIGNDIESAVRFFENNEAIGEFTLIIKGYIKSEDDVLDKLEIKKELDELIKAGLSLSAASKYLAKKKELRKNLIYNLY